MKKIIFIAFLFWTNFVQSQRIEAEAYTAQQGMNLISTTDIDGGKQLDYILDGQWAEYAVTPGSYTISFRIASPYTGAGITIDNFTYTLPKTGGWETWQTTDEFPIIISGNKIRMTANGGAAFNFNWFELKPVAAPPPVYDDTTICFPIVKVKEFDNLYGTFSLYPFTIQVKDSLWKEKGYLRYDAETDKWLHRGTYIDIYRWFVNWFNINWQVLGYARNVADMINSDGTVKDLTELKKRMAAYDAIRAKYGMR